MANGAKNPAGERKAAAPASVPSFPLSSISREDAAALSSPAPFDGIWTHSTNAFDKIVAGGWKPNLVENTIYGAAIYLARGKWELSHAGVFECVLRLKAEETRSAFESRGVSGDSQNHVLWYIGDQSGSLVGRNSGPGSSAQNQRIKAFFLKRNIRAIHFQEHGTAVLAVYGPTCIRVIQ